MVFNCTIPGRLVGLNEIIAAAKRHHMQYSKLKKEQTEYCAWYFKAARMPVFNKPIHLKIRWIEKARNRDIDNVQVGVKFILDAMVSISSIKDDGRKWVKKITHEFPDPDKLNPRIEITVEEID